MTAVAPALTWTQGKNWSHSYCCPSLLSAASVSVLPSPSLPSPPHFPAATYPQPQLWLWPHSAPGHKGTKHMVTLALTWPCSSNSSSSFSSNHTLRLGHRLPLHLLLLGQAGAETIVFHALGQSGDEAKATTDGN